MLSQLVSLLFILRKMILISQEQELQIAELKLDKVPHRDISERVFGVRSRASTVHYVLKRLGLVEDRSKKLSEGRTEPRILTFDIETAPCLGYHWGLWQQNIGLNMVVRDWAVLSWSAKWVGNDEVMYDDCREFFDGSSESMFAEIDDAAIVRSVWELLDEADIVITQNGKKIDRKKLNARFLRHGLQPPSSYKHIDTLQIAKKEFAFTSNKLEYMTDKFCTKYKKLTHGAFPGFYLWKECMLGNEAAWEEMKEYNQYDVLSLEELAYKLAPWSNQIPNMDMYHDTEENVCFCGCTDWAHTGYAYTQLSKFDKFKCNECGAEKRGRVNLLSKGKLKSLRMNVL